MFALRRTLPALALMGTAALASSALAGGEDWSHDFAASQEKAAAQDKDLLMDFTGSDWCPPCIALKKNVFSTEAFLSSAPDNFVLVELDYPNDVPQPEEVVAQNAELAQRYMIESYPTVILADAEGKPYAVSSGYGGQDAEAYLAQLDEWRENKTDRDEAMTRAENAEGDEKARALHEAMQAVGLELAVQHYPDTVAMIMEMDADGSLGLKADYEQAGQQQQLESDMEAAMQLLQTGQMEEGLAALDEVLEKGPAPDAKQMILAVQGQVHAQMGNFDKALASIDASIQAMPESPLVPQIQQLRQQLEQVSGE